MPVEDLALRVLDRLATTPSDRLGALLSREVFINAEVTQTEVARRRQPGIPSVTRSEEALLLQPELARAYAEAWDYCLARGWLAAEPQRPRFVFVTRLGQERLHEYRTANGASVHAAADGERESAAYDLSPHDDAAEAEPRAVPALAVPSIAAERFVAAVGDDHTLFLFDGERLRPIDELSFFALGGTRGAVKRLQRDALARRPLGPPLSKTFDDGTLVKGSADPIYVIERGRKRWVPDMETLAALSKKQPYRLISDEALDLLPDGPPVPSVTAKNQLRSPLFGRLRRLPPTVSFAADLVTVGGALAGIAKLAGLW
jgi:hypothetical protein